MTVTAALRLRVWVTDVWDAVVLTLPPDATVGDLKAAALARAAGRAENPADYVAKYRGALLSDERATLLSLGVPDGAPFIVLPARRRPVR